MPFDNELFCKLLILRTPGIGAVKYAGLIDKFGGAAPASESLKSDSAFADSVRREMDLAESLGIRYISDDSPDYPKNLRLAKNHPPVLSVRGNFAALQKPAVAIVGTRHASAAGMRFVSELAESFAGNGFAIVSGMAMGTDAAAHTGALKVGATIAILAGGVDYIWPLENERLYYYILDQGAIVSEMPVGSKPVASNFIQRNRWIAGISEKLILGEADIKSGSMATAGFALEYGRPVYAIPGHPSDPRSAGPNRLIKEGKAILCEGKNDFFADARHEAESKISNQKSEIPLLDLIGIIPQSESVLADLAKKSVGEIKSELVVLELQGLVGKSDGGYVRA